MNLDTATRIGIGGVGTSVVFALLPLIFPQMNLLVMYAGLAVGVAASIWGFWPLLPILTLGDVRVWKVPLMQAARICYEKCEGTPIGKWVFRVNDTPHKRLSYFIASFMTNEVPMYGERPPSTVARRISVDESKHVIAKDDSNNLMNLHNSSELAFRNVYVRRFDLWRHLRYLKKLNGDEEVKRLFR